MSITLVLASADCLWPDIERARALIGERPFRVVACNQAATEWPFRLDHFATMHPEQMAPWLEARARRGYPMDFETWTRPYPFGMKHREKLCDHAIDGWAGSSGLLALGVAIETGGTRNILCGMPMDQRAHFNSGAWNAAAAYRKRWEELADTLRRTTRSAAPPNPETGDPAWTVQLLGSPTQEWLS